MDIDAKFGLSPRIAAADGVTLGSAVVNTSGAPTNQFKYTALGTPITLPAYSTFYIVSEEFNGGDQWHSYDNVLVTTQKGSVHGSVHSIVTF